MEKETEQRLIYAIALRVGTGKTLADSFGITLPELKQFVADNHDRLLATRERLEAPEPATSGKALSPGQLSDLWITNKYERLKRMQDAAEEMQNLMNGSLSAAELATAVRELRSYMQLAANELGQLLHRGAGDAGDGSYLAVTFNGVDMEQMK